MATWGKLKQDGVTWHDLEGVTWGALEDFCTINPKTKQIPDDMEVSFVPMQSVSDTGDVQTDEIRKASEVKKGFTFFEEGDVLFAKITPCMENGKGGIARGLKNGVGFGSTEFHVLHPDPEKVSSEWLYYLTSWDEFRKQCARNMTGSAGQKRVPKSYLEHYKVHLPPLEEQRRIAALLDRVSDLIAKRRAQLDKLDLLVKARFVEMFGDPVKNDKGLPTMMGQNFFKLSNGKFVPENKRLDSGIPAYGGNGVSWCTDEILCKENTIVVGRVGFQSGNVHFVKGPLWITDNAMYISNYNTRKYDLFFLYVLMEHIDFTRFQDAGDLKKITQKPFMSMEYIMPTLSRQREYVAFAKQIDKSKLTLQQSLDKLETLKKALMQQYFG